MPRHSLRIATVPYCNAFPLTHYLPQELPDAEIIPYYPSKMRQQLLADEIDLALMPVAELLRTPCAKIVSNCSIASDGDVRSVKLFSKKPIEEIQTLALDTASRSSVTICRLILQHFYHIVPIQEDLPLDAPLNSCSSDAFVVIGDRCMSYVPLEQWQYRCDLGGLWKQNTGLPLVFAAWIGINAQSSEPETIQSLETARDKGLTQLELLIKEEVRRGVKLPLPENEVLDYYRNAIVYTLSERANESLQLFLDLARHYDL
ncbi:chorismate dehydratase [Planctomycetales bacterium]|nr:chorismate dehydratase [Planctomycetales bacterium]